MSEAPLERLHPEFGDVGIVLPLRRFDKSRANQPCKIDCLNHD
jgi:hypothetical protein